MEARPAKWLGFRTSSSHPNRRLSSNAKSDINVLGDLVRFPAIRSALVLGFKGPYIIVRIARRRSEAQEQQQQQQQQPGRLFHPPTNTTMHFQQTTPTARTARRVTLEVMLVASRISHKRPHLSRNLSTTLQKTRKS